MKAMKGPSMLRFGVASVVTVALLVAAPSAFAVGFTVNSNGGGADVAIDGVCDADPTADVDCTLRAAVEEANATIAPDGIVFQKSSDSGGDPDDTAFVTGKPAATVALGGTIPTITAGLSIAAGNCAPDLPIIDDPPTPCASLGALNINSSGEVTIVGLAFTGSSNTAIDVNIVGARPEPEFKLLNSWFGMDTAGEPTAGAPTTDVLLRAETQGAEIGGDPQTGPNLFARHHGAAVDILGADNTVISNNQFGVLPDGSFARAGEGVTSNGSNIEVTDDSTGLDPATGTVIGGSNPFQAATPECEGSCNLIAFAGAASVSNPGNAGIDLLAESADGEAPVDGVLIVGNQLKQNATGIAVGGATNVQIGGPAAQNADRNLVDRSPIRGGEDAAGLLIENNLVSNLGGLGTAPPLHLAGSGEILNNVISSRASSPAGAILLEDTSPPNYVIQGNKIGEDADGDAVIGGNFGIELRAGADGNVIGGSDAGDGNTISSRLTATTVRTGIVIASDGNVVSGNRIGTDSNGSPGTLLNGIELITDADNNTVGGSIASAENLVSNVGDDAIVITNANSDGNQILRNRGFANGNAADDLFLDLGDDGVGNLVEPNGPNTGAQAPTISIASANQAAGTAAPNAVVRLFAKADATTGELEGFLTQATASSAGTWAASFSSQPHGKRLVATSTLALSTSELSSPAAVDAVAPETQIDSGPPPGAGTADSTPTFEFSSGESGSTFRCRIDTAAFAACSGPGATHTPAALSEGSHTFEARATDSAANVDATPASRVFTVDTVSPDTQIDSGPAAGSTTGDSTPSFGFSATEVESTFECRIDADAFASCSGPGPEHTATALSDGAHTFEVRAIDSAGNVDGSPAAREFVVAPGPTPPTADTDPPETTIDKAPKRKSAKRKAKFAFSSDEPGSTFECRVDKNQFETCTARTRFKTRPGKHTLEVRALDPAGNVDPTPAKAKWKVRR